MSHKTMSELIPSAAVEAIQDSVRTETIEVQGREFATRPVFDPPAAPMIPALKIHTLTGLLDYVVSNPDILDHDKMFLHVVSPTEVRLFTACEVPAMRRPNPATADCKDLLGDVYRFGQYRSVEESIVDFQAKFVPSEDLAAAIAIIGNLKEETVNSYSQDGFTQTVQTRQGIQGVAWADVPSSLVLRPYRTFPEIEQPEGRFILRLRKSTDKDGGIQCALFEAGYSTWQAQAIKDIAIYLNGELQGRDCTEVVVIA
jgi:hypothetical protein